MKFFFLDDTRQRTPSRDGMGPLVAVGAVCVDGEVVGELEREIDATCMRHGFPNHEEFKWSPGRELWMRDGLTGDGRLRFFQDVLAVAVAADVRAIVVIEDTNYSKATDAATPEANVVRLCLERVCLLCSANPPTGVVIADRPSGNQASDAKFLASCLDDTQAGVGYLRHNALALNVITTPSKFVRLLQLADLITGSTLAAVGGETVYSPPVIEAARPLYRREYGRIGGCGVKIHPDFRYANLYHWVLGDHDFVRFQSGVPLPLKGRPYADDPTVA